MKYSRPIRILHLLLAAGISAQLVLSLVMKAPKPGRTLDVVIGPVFPWFSRIRLAALIHELKEMGRLRLANPEAQNGLASAVQGLGLVIASLLASTGMVLYLGIAANGIMSPAVHAVKEFHETLGPLMWAYLGIHVGATMLHRFVFKHRSILSIFRLFR
uniref:Cytochrome b561 bacterial/Ni-hydrogenase domain-containing protein n=1 Tax=mine drainage metagenome TaxID=410659 RepID=E6QVM4_9ZZZZ